MTTPVRRLLGRFVRVLEWHHFGKILPLLVLAASLAVAHLLWKNEHQETFRDRQTHFDSHVSETVRHVEDRMKVYEQMLRGVKALFAASENIGRDNFHA